MARDEIPLTQPRSKQGIAWRSWKSQIYGMDKEKKKE